MATKVKATQTGLYGNRIRQPGDVFDVEEERHVSKVWMEPVEEKRGPGRPPKVKPEDS